MTLSQLKNIKDFLDLKKGDIRIVFAKEKNMDVIIDIDYRKKSIKSKPWWARVLLIKTVMQDTEYCTKLWGKMERLFEVLRMPKWRWEVKSTIQTLHNHHFQYPSSIKPNFCQKPS